MKAMLNFAPLFEFSRNHCAAICAFLVPANLLATSQTLLLLFLQRPIPQIRLAAIFASIFALTLFLHVGTWFAIGVVQTPTFILLGLGTTCLVINFWAITDSRSFQKLLQLATIAVSQKLARLHNS